MRKEPAFGAKKEAIVWIPKASVNMTTRSTVTKNEGVGEEGVEERKKEREKGKKGEAQQKN